MQQSAKERIFDTKTLDTEAKMLYTCPLSNYNRLFIDPIIASNGITYERKNIEKYIQTYHKLPIITIIMVIITMVMKKSKV